MPTDSQAIFARKAISVTGGLANKRLVRIAYKHKLFWLLLLCLYIQPYVCSLQAQAYVEVQTYCSDTTLQIGERLPCALVARHNDSVQLLFPQQGDPHFYPLHLLRRKLYPTRYDHRGKAVDSVVYVFTLLDIVDSLRLQLPVYYLIKQDTIRILSEPIQIYFRSVLPEAVLSSDTFRLQHESYVPPLPDPKPIYMWWILLGGGGLLLVLRVYVPLRRYVRKLLRLYRYEQQWQEFLSICYEQGKQAIELQDRPQLEAALHYWKEYLGYLSQRPMKSLTTNEIAGLWLDDRLQEALQRIDIAIYGSQFDERLLQDWQYLRELAEKQFVRFREVIRKEK